MHNTFQPNRYLAVYLKIVNRAVNENRSKGTGYYEDHHILPRSLGGNNQKSNRVLLTAKEHYVCHRLLVKFTTGQDKYKMKWALDYMGKRYLHLGVQSAAKYERDRLANRMIGVSHPRYGKKDTKDQIERKRQRVSGSLNPNYGKPLSEEAKVNLSIKNSGSGNPFFGKSHVGEFADRNRGETHAMYGKRHSPETREKIGIAVSLGQTGDKNHRFGKPVSDKEKQLQAERMKGRKWMNNGIEQRFVGPPIVTDLLNDGWVFGRVR